MTDPIRRATMDSEFSLELAKLDDMLAARTGLEIICLLCQDRDTRHVATIAGPHFMSSVGPHIITALKQAGFFNE